MSLVHRLANVRAGITAPEAAFCSYCFLSITISALAIVRLLFAPALLCAFLGTVVLFGCFQAGRFSISINFLRKKSAWALILFAVGLLHILLIPPFMRDDMMYHLAVPAQMLRYNRFLIDPLNIAANYPLLFEAPLILAERFRWISPFIVNCVMLILLTAALVDMSRKHFQASKETLLLLIPLVVTIPALYALLYSCSVEIFFALAIVCAMNRYLYFREDLTAPHNWYWCAFFVGSACAIKYTGFFYALFFAGIGFAGVKRRRAYYIGLIIMMIPAAPWYIKNWIMLGNPVYPLLNDIFQSPEISALRYHQFISLLHNYHDGRSITDYLMLPLKLCAGIEGFRGPGRLGFGGRLSLSFLLCVAGLSFRSSKERLMSIFFVLFFLFWVFSSQQVRFLLPALLPGIAFSAARLASLWARKRRMLSLFLVLILLQQTALIGMDLKNQKILPLLIGKMNREQFLSAHMPFSYHLAGTANALLDARRHKIWTIGNFGRSYYFEIPVISNMYYEEELLDKAFSADSSTEMIGQFMDKNAITHLLMNRSYYFMKTRELMGIDLGALDKYLESNFRLIAANGPAGLLERIAP